jgi:hypothetical protein
MHPGAIHQHAPQAKPGPKEGGYYLVARSRTPGGGVYYLGGSYSLGGILFGEVLPHTHRPSLGKSRPCSADDGKSRRAAVANLADVVRAQLSVTKACNLASSQVRRTTWPSHGMLYVPRKTHVSHARPRTHALHEHATQSLPCISMTPLQCFVRSIVYIHVCAAVCFRQSFT